MVRQRPCGAKPLAFWAPSAKRGHVGLDPGFVDEHETFGVEAALPGLPAFAAAGDIRPALLNGEQRFF